MTALLEQFSGVSVSTLNGSINAITTTLVVADASSFPTVGYFRIRVDNEVMRVDAVAGNTFTVVRAADDSTATTHADGVEVIQVLTSGALAQYAVDTYNRDAFATPAAAAAGRLLLANDSSVLRRDQGAGNALVGFGNVRKVILPNLASFTWANQGGATADTSKNYLLLWEASATSQWRQLRIAMPTPPFTLRARIVPHTFTANYNKCALGFYESATGKFETIESIHVNGQAYEQNLWNSIGSYNSTRNRHYTYRNQSYNREWMSLRHDGTNLYYGIGVDDGYNFWEYSSAAKNAFFTTGPDTLFMGFVLDSAAAGGGMSVYHWETF